MTEERVLLNVLNGLLKHLDRRHPMVSGRMRLRILDFEEDGIPVDTILAYVLDIDEMLDATDKYYQYNPEQLYETGDRLS